MDIYSKARTVLFALHEIKGVGWKTIERIFLSVHPFERVMEMNVSELVRIGIQSKIAQLINERLKQSFILETEKKYEQANVKYVTIYDREYPELLRHTAEPPWVLYYKGNIQLLSANSIAIVGTRYPTAYGKKVAYDLSRQLSHSGFTVVSGLARGIDTAAHQGALSGKGRTIAVLGTGIERVYPAENVRLYQQIIEEGLMITEYPMGTLMKAGLFPRRNRIIASLSLGTLVVEAAEKSGSLITADCALEESRDVFAVPGPIYSENSKGTLQLIREGAKMVASIEDIVSEYEQRLDLDDYSCITESTSRKNRLNGLDENERIIADLIGDIPISFDDLMEESKFSFGLLHSVLLSLLMKKRILQLPGSYYVSK